jgi:heat-inducible transcriptional repressor
MPTPALDERGREVLKTLIQLHVLTGEPVGSETLARALERQHSSATLRNVMAELERLGFLDHPHTSAGRVPTDDGYRFYVDSLMSHQPLPPQDAAAIAAGLRAPEGAPSQVLEKASSLLSRLSHNVGFVVAPDLAQTRFARIDLVRLPFPRILVVLVSATGFVTQKVIAVEEDLSPEDLQTCANYLNAHFTGMPLGAVRARLLELMQEEKALYDSLLKRVVSVGEQAFAADDSSANVFIGGASNIVGRPEFEDIGRMRQLFQTFEEKGRLVKILSACISGQGVRIVIGHENPDPELRDLALVALGLDDEPGLSLGVLGSTRMEYPRTIALVEHVARAVQKALTELRP